MKRPLLKEIQNTFRLAIPIVAGQVGQMLFGLTDNIMVGKIGATPLAAAAFVNNLTAIPMTFLVGVSASISVMVARTARKDPGAVLKHVMAGLILTLGLLCAFLIASFLYPDFLVLFQQPDEVHALSGNYFTLIAWSMVPMVIYQSLRQFSVGIERPTAPTVILGVGLVVNVLLNYALIYGRWGAPELGLAGSGWATLIARIVIAAFIIALVLRGRDYAPFMSATQGVLREAFCGALSKVHMGPIAKIGLTSGIQYLFEVAAFATAGFMAGWVGTKALAAHQVSLNVASMTFMFAWGVSFAASVRIGNSSLHEARLRAKAALFLIAGIMGFFSLVMVATHKVLPRLYIDDPEVIALASELLLICAILQVVDGLQGVAIGILRGFGDVTFPTVATALVYWGVCMPVAYWLAFKQGMGTHGLWWGLSLGLLLSAGLLSFRIHKLTRII
jgi:multidrug resistance protein, MATE family